MGFLTELVTGWNLVYTIPAICVLCFWLLTIVSGIDLDFLDLDVDLDTDMDLDLDVDTDLDFPTPMGGGLMHILSTLGIGAIPLPMHLTMVTMPWAFAGLLANKFILGADALAPMVLGIAFVLFLVSYALSYPVVRLLNPFFHSVKQSDMRAEDFVGYTATVLSSAADAGFGEAKLIDKWNIEHTIAIRSYGPSFRQGEQVMVVDFNPETLIFKVEEVPYSTAELPLNNMASLGESQEEKKEGF